MVEFGSSIDQPPAIGIKTPELFLNCEKRPRVAYRSFDFHPVPNDCRIQCELLNSFLGIPRHSPRIELAEGMAISFPLFEHDRPTQPGLCRFEHKELKVFSVIVDWHTPFAIVILEHQRIVRADPGTPFRSHISADFGGISLRLPIALISQDRLVPDGDPDGAPVPNGICSPSP